MTSGNPTAVSIQDTFASSDVEEAIDAETAERGKALSASGERKNSFASVAFGSKSSLIFFGIALIIPGMYSSSSRLCRSSIDWLRSATNHGWMALQG